MTLWTPPAIPVFPDGYGPLDADFTNWIQATLGFCTQGIGFRAHQVAGGGQALAAGNTVLQYDTIDEDPFAGWSAVATASQPAYSWLVPYTGTYEMTVYASLAAQGIFFGAGVSVTGTVVVGTDTNTPSGTEGGACASWTQSLTAGSDWIQGVASASASCSTDTSSAGRYPAMEITYVSG